MTATFHHPPTTKPKPTRPLFQGTHLLLALHATAPIADPADVVRHGPRRRRRLVLEADAAAGGALPRVGVAHGAHAARRRPAGHGEPHEPVLRAGLRQPSVHGVEAARVHLVRAEGRLGQGGGGGWPKGSGAGTGAAGHGVGRRVGVARGCAAGVGAAADGAAVLVRRGVVGARGEGAAVAGRRGAGPLGLGLVGVVVLGRPGRGVGALGPSGAGVVVGGRHGAGCGEAGSSG